jgi:hypothetical protein
MRQVSRPGVKPDIVLRAAAASGCCCSGFGCCSCSALGFRTLSLAGTNGWSKGQVWDDLAMRAELRYACPSSKAKLASVCKTLARVLQSKFRT